MSGRRGAQRRRAPRRVIGEASALGAVMAAFASLDSDHLCTTVAATAAYCVAAEHAAAQTAGPGSFAVAFLDHLASLTPDRLLAEARLEVLSAS